jgi:hypothetical protein
MNAVTTSASFVAKRELSASFAEPAHQLLYRLRRVDDFAEETDLASIGFGRRHSVGFLVHIKTYVFAKLFDGPPFSMAALRLWLNKPQA